MIRGLAQVWCAAAERRLRDVRRGAVVGAAVALLAAVSLGFATFAAYACLRASEGPALAALIVGAAYGLLALAIWAIGTARRRPRPQRPTATPPPEDIDALPRSSAAAGTEQDLLALIAALRLGRELSPMELVALALVGGLIAGKKLGK
jgi:hypothetical protein